MTEHLVNRRTELRQLHSWLANRPSEPLVVLGPGGIGKTSLLRTFARRVIEQKRDPRGVVFADLYDRPEADNVDKAVRGAPSGALLLVDGAEIVPPRELVDTVERVRLRSPDLAVLVAGRQTPNELWPAMHLEGLDEAAAALLIRRRADVSGTDAARLARASQGFPLVASLLAVYAERESVDDVLARLGQQRFDGIVPLAADSALGDAVGGDDASPAEREIEVRVSAVNDALIKHLARHPALLYQLRPRQLEELMAELYAREGFEVELTQPTHDGGVDLYLVRHTPFGKLLTVVDTKRNRSDRVVGVGVVRQMLGVVEAKRASAGVVATTSFFSPEAHRLQQTIPFRLGLQDYFDLQTMLRDASARQA